MIERPDFGARSTRNGGRRKTSRMGEGGTMRQAVTVLSQLKKDEDRATLTQYTALIAILIVVVILTVRELGSWISESVAIISNF